MTPELLQIITKEANEYPGRNVSQFRGITVN